MFKTQKYIDFFKKDSGFIILITIVIVSSFIFLSPKISSMLLSFKSQMVLNDFITNARTNQKLDTQKYWEFREFYSHGYFNFSRNKLDQSLINKTQNFINVDYNTKSTFPFLVYTSPKLKSIDMLTTEKKLSIIIDKNKLKVQELIFQNENSIIYKTHLGNVVIIFLTGRNEMKKANGFLDYEGNDKDLVKDKYWLNITSITTD